MALEVLSSPVVDCEKIAQKEASVKGADCTVHGDIISVGAWLEYQQAACALSVSIISSAPPVNGSGLSGKRSASLSNSSRSRQRPRARLPLR